MSFTAGSMTSSSSSNKRKLRSGNEFDPLAPPPKRQSTSPKPAKVITNQTYHMENFPTSLKAKKISQIFVDFLHIGIKDAMNHTIMRVIFAREQKVASAYAPANTTGLVLNFSPSGVILDVSPVPGDMEIGTIGYTTPHTAALHTIKLTVSNNKTVRDIFAVIEDVGLLPAGFNVRGAEGFDLGGCRDFVSQLIYHLNESNVIKLPTDAATSVYDDFNYRYAKDEARTATPSGLALAAYTSYAHEDIEGINYEADEEEEEEL